MKITKHIVIFIGLISGLILVASVKYAYAASVVNDDFNAYSTGSIVGQGGWSSYVNGGNFKIQGVTTFEGAQALYNNSYGDAVVGKLGTPQADGRQSLYIQTENRSKWGFYNNDGNVGVRISKGLNASGLSFVNIGFTSDGRVTYYDQASNAYKNFATYNDNEWTLLEVEWRSIDKTARYRVNNGAWTDWYLIANSTSFSSFDYVNVSFILTSGSGGVYFDGLYSTPLSPSPAPSPSSAPPPPSPTPAPSLTPTSTPILTPTPISTQIPTPQSISVAPTPTPTTIPAPIPTPPPTSVVPIPIPTLTLIPTPTLSNNDQTLQSILDQIKALQNQLSLLQSSRSAIPSALPASSAANEPSDTGSMVSACVSLVSNLTYRSRDASTNGDVSALQDFLQAKGYLTSEPTGFFGIATLRATKKFQSNNHINPTGFVGVFTRAKIKELSCQ